LNTYEETKPNTSLLNPNNKRAKMMASTFFFVRVARKYVRINYADVIYMESVANYIKIHTENGCHLTLLTVKELVDLLPPGDFCRINRGIIIPVNRITAYDHYEVMLGKISFTFGKGYKKFLQEKVVVFEVKKEDLNDGLPVEPLSEKPVKKSVCRRG
jgi:DNA-binding LytR/AlgR family response regulator